MHTLTHYRLCPLSRSIRLVLGELGLGFELEEVAPWALDAGFLARNPAAELPILQLEGGPMLCGVYSISEFIAEEMRRHPVDGMGVPLFPGSREERAEVRRLVDWANGKLNREVTQELLIEKVYGRMAGARAAAPNVEALRAVRANLKYHLSYFAYLADGRNWLAGEDLSFADLSAAAQLSVVDYLGEVPWDAHPAAKGWYERIKSRKSFRALLADKIPGLAPPPHYTALDF